MSKIDLFCESVMIWATTGRICEDMYFAIRHCLFHVFAATNCRRLPYIRQAEKQLKPYNKHLYPQYTITERLGIGLCCPVILFIIPISITFITLIIFDFPLIVSMGLPFPSDSSDILAGYLKIMATVLATVTAIFLTVIAFTIQVKTSNLAGADFLLNSIIRRHGFIPIASFLLGTVLCTLVGIFMSHLLSLRSLNDYTFIAGVLSLFSLTVLLNLLRSTMQTLGSSELGQLLSSELVSSLRISFRRALKQGLFEKHFSEGLADLGFARIYATEKQENHPTEYKLKRFGKIISVDSAPLKKISHILRLTPIPRERNISQVLLYRPEDNAPYITVQPNGNVNKESCLALLTKEEKKNRCIKSRIRNAFIIKKQADSKLEWQRIYELLLSAITKYESTTTITVANALNDTFDDYLGAQQAVAGHGNLVLEDFVGSMIYSFEPPHPFNLRFSELIIYAAETRSHHCLDELINCVYKLAQTAFYRENEKYFRDWIFEYYRAYNSFILKTKDESVNIAPDISRRVYWLSQLIYMDVYPQVKSTERIRKVSPYAIIYYRLCLHILKASSERCDKTTFDSVTEHAVQFFKNELKDNKSMLDIYCNVGQDSRSGSAPQDNRVEQKQKLCLAYNDLYDYKNLVWVIAGAWLMHKIKTDELEAEKVAPFIEKLIGSTENLRSLLDLYAMPGMGGVTSSHDNPLGFGGWDWPYSPYPKVRMGTDFGKWIKPFYQYLFLKKAAGGIQEAAKLKNIRQTEMANHESLKIFLGEIADQTFDLPAEYQNKPWSLEPTDIEAGKSQLNALIDSWSNEQNSTSA